MITLPFYFNSIKVQLKPCLSVLISSALPLFQFHKGTIKTVEEERRQIVAQISIP